MGPKGPKVSKKEQLRQAKLEAWLEVQRRQRVNMEEEEFQARKETEFNEDFYNQNIKLQKLHEYVLPESVCRFLIVFYSFFFIFFCFI